MNLHKSLYLIMLAVLGCFFTAVMISCQELQESNRNEPVPGTKPENLAGSNPGKKEPARPSGDPREIEGFNRREKKLVFSKHALCRMACRHIDEEEVREILLKGRVNERKSEPAGRPDPKYALEGKTRDGQEVRIVFAPSSRGMVVVTVIDLGTNWPCDCK